MGSSIFFLPWPFTQFYLHPRREFGAPCYFFSKYSLKRLATASAMDC
jgi:hypothetical protein